ncbi:MAG: T9SS type A sorting domain-containing protein [Chlorobi bacterium]|nr:T9SS type A sorting domain-containing protein [Chlorobiota bacterium]
MKTKLLIVMWMSFMYGSAQLPAFEWAIGSDGPGRSAAEAVAVDTLGNIVVTGYFENTIDLDPDMDTLEFTSVGYRDIFIEKFDPDGNLLWAKQIGSTGYDYGYGIVCDNENNVYVTGTYSWTTDFDPGNGVYELTPKAWNDIFVLKLDADGNFVWVAVMEGTQREEGDAITIDNDGYLLVTGKIEGSTDFDPDPNREKILDAGGSDDIFILKLDTAGGYVWAKQFSGEGENAGNAIVTDNENNVLVTGYFNRTVDFDPDEYKTKEITVLGYIGYNDIFVVKLNSDGNLVWIKQIGGNNHQEGNGIDVDTDNNIFITGTFQDTVDFDPGDDIKELTAISTDIFVESLDQNGNFKWVKHIGNENSPKSFDIAYAGNGNIYVTGGFQSTIDFNPEGGGYELTAVGGYDIFVEEMDNNGEFIWAGTMGGKNNTDYGYDITKDKNNNIITAGVYNGDADFDPGTDVYTLPCPNTWGTLFVQKLAFNGTSTFVPENFMDNIGIYPNPAYNFVNVSFGEKYINAKIEIFNISGMAVETVNVSYRRLYTLSLHQKKGLYLVKVTTGKKSKVFKLLVK